MKSVGQRMIDALRGFTEDLENPDSTNTYRTSRLTKDGRKAEHKTAAEILDSVRKTGTDSLQVEAE